MCEDMDPPIDGLPAAASPTAADTRQSHGSFLPFDVSAAKRLLVSVLRNARLGPNDGSNSHGQVGILHLRTDLSKEKSQQTQRRLSH